MCIRDSPRLALGIAARGLPDLAKSVRCVGLGFSLEPMNQLRLRLPGRNSSERLEPSFLLADQTVELLFAFGYRFFLATKLARAPAHVLLALLEHVELAIEHRFAVLNPLFLPLNFFSSPSGLDLPFFSYLDYLF